MMAERSWWTTILGSGTAVVLAMAVGACSFSASSESSSDSISGSSDSISKSSTSSSPSSGEKSQAYRDDVRDYTVARFRGGGSPQAFQRGLGRVAEQHGITDWEAVLATYEAIGRGLGMAGASPGQLQTYQSELAGIDASRAAALEQGYRAARS